MREIRTSGLMSGDGKRGFATAPVLDSTDQGAQASCVTNTPSDRRVWCYAGDEGWPLEVGSQVQASNRCKLRP